MKNIHSICRKVAAVDDEELAEAQKIAEGQRSHIHPLKLARAGRVQKAGCHNERVLAKFRELRDTILEGV